VSTIHYNEHYRK